jgi:predicted small integral membrane protein
MKGYSISTLPISVEIFYNNISVRIFRVIGGISFLMVVSKTYLNLPENLHLFCTIIAAIQITQIIIKIFYDI